MATPQVTAGDSTPASVPTVEVDNNPVSTEGGKQEKEKSGIKKFWPFKKKDDSKSKDAARSSAGGLTSDYSSRSPRSGSPVPGPAAGMSAPTSPARGGGGAGASPRVASPASSQIFERNVQEESLAPAAVPTAIPSHIATENHIPPALDASSHAITDEKLNPDTVEIFTHAAHTPAAITVAQGTGGGSVSGVAPSGLLSEASASPTLPATSEEAAASRSPQLAQIAAAGGAASPASLDDGTSSYGALDSTDVRRLSFISFADVVHGEQSQSVGGGSESGAGGATAGGSAPPGHSSGNLGPTSVPMQPMSPALSATSPIISSPLRSASPVRPPQHHQPPGGASSPARAVSPSNNSLSPSNAGGSPKIVGASPSPPAGGVVGELAVETMSQALRKTGSGDIGAARERDRERDAMSSGGSAEGLGLGTR